MVDPDGTNDRRVIGDFNDNIWQTCPTYSPDGRSLAYFEDGRLRVTQVETRGRPVGVATRSQVALKGSFSCGVRSPQGDLLAIHTNDDLDGTRLHTISLTEGTTLTLPDLPTSGRSVWDSEGEWLAFPTEGGIGVYDLRTQAVQTLPTSDDPIDLSISSDGANFAYVTEVAADGSSHVYLIDTDGQGERRITIGDGWRAWPSWAPSQHLLTFVEETCDPMRCSTHLVIYDGERIVDLPQALIDGIERSPRGPLEWSLDGQTVLHSGVELANMEGLPTKTPPIKTPVRGSPQGVTAEFGIVSYDWQPVPVR